MNTYLFMFQSNLYWKYIPGGKFAQEKGPQIHCVLRVQAFLAWFFFKFYQLNKLWREERNCVWPKLESRFMMLKKITRKGSSLTKKPKFGSKYGDTSMRVRNLMWSYVVSEPDHNFIILFLYSNPITAQWPFETGSWWWWQPCWGYQQWSWFIQQWWKFKFEK